jgi:MFS family permease
MDSPSSRWSVITYLFSTFVFWTALYVYIPVLAPYANHLGGSMTVVGLVVASYGFMQLVFRIPLGIWSDRIGRRKPFLVASLVILAVSTLGLAISPTAEWMIAARALGGLAACGWVVWSVMYAGFFAPDRATAAMSHMTMCSAAGQMASTYAGGWIAEAFGWRMPFYAGAGLALLSLLSLLPVPDRVADRPRSLTVERIKSIGLTSSLLTVSLVAALSQYAAFITIYGFTPVYATEIGATKSQLGTLILIGMLWQTVASFLCGVWCARGVGERRLVVGGFLLTGLGTALIPYTGTVSALYVAQAVSGVGRGFIQPVLMGLAVQSVAQDERGTAMGVFQAVYAAGMFAGPAVGGLLGDWIGMAGIFLSTAAVCGASAAAAAFCLRGCPERRAK